MAPPSAFHDSSNGKFDFARLMEPELGPSHVPLYRKLGSSLQAAIQSGALRAGEGIPPERDLAQALGVSRITVRRAIGDLAQQGLLSSRQGSGTVVAERLEQGLSDLGSFSDDIRRRGMVPGSRWMSRMLATPCAEEASALQLGAADRVIRIERVRTANGAPIAVERAALDARWLNGDIEFGDSLYAALRRFGVVPQRALQRLRAEVVRGADARLLELADGEPVLATERRSFSAEERPIEFTRALYRGDRYDYLVQLQAVPVSAKPAREAARGKKGLP